MSASDSVSRCKVVTRRFVARAGLLASSSGRVKTATKQGKSAVSNGTREEMERDVQAMHEYGLWATLEKQA